MLNTETRGKWKYLSNTWYVFPLSHDLHQILTCVHRVVLITNKIIVFCFVLFYSVFCSVVVQANVHGIAMYSKP